jgi:hypothetical protein
MSDTRIYSRSHAERDYDHALLVLKILDLYEAARARVPRDTVYEERLLGEARNAFVNGLSWINIRNNMTDRETHWDIFREEEPQVARAWERFHSSVKELSTLFGLLAHERNDPDPVRCVYHLPGLRPLDWSLFETFRTHTAELGKALRFTNDEEWMTAAEAREWARQHGLSMSLSTINRLSSEGEFRWREARVKKAQREVEVGSFSRHLWRRLNRTRPKR